MSDIFDTSVQAALRYGDWKIITGDPGFDSWVPEPTLYNKDCKWWWVFSRHRGLIYCQQCHAMHIVFAMTDIGRDMIRNTAKAVYIPAWAYSMVSNSIKWENWKVKTRVRVFNKLLVTFHFLRTKWSIFTIKFQAKFQAVYMFSCKNCWNCCYFWT